MEAAEASMWEALEAGQAEVPGAAPGQGGGGAERAVDRKNGIAPSCSQLSTTTVPVSLDSRQGISQAGPQPTPLEGSSQPASTVFPSQLLLPSACCPPPLGSSRRNQEFPNSGIPTIIWLHRSSRAQPHILRS